MIQFSVTVSNSKGFHLRPASKLLQLVSGFEAAEVSLLHEESGRSADCRNMMALMMMSSPQGTEFKVHVNAANEAEIQKEITELFANGFGDES